MEKHFSQKAKKSLGQNFLKSEKALNKIIEASKIEKGDIVLEIGPGRGALTKKLLEAGASVIAVEKDETLADELKNYLTDYVQSNQLEIIKKDVLDFFVSDYKKIKNYKLVANIPYYITGALIEKFLTEKNQPTSITFLVQKEVAERIVSKDNKESILSISVKVFGVPKYISTVPKGAFIPAPKIDSAIINISNISNSIFKENKITEKRFFEVVKSGFAHKRKQLGSNLKNVIDEKRFSACEIDPKNRAENLTVENWICLSKK
jgi:16S rRNA (adenine1518-N6/adenine1519-N6)-dimethyltransferase